MKPSLKARAFFEKSYHRDILAKAKKEGKEDIYKEYIGGEGFPVIAKKLGVYDDYQRYLAKVEKLDLNDDATRLRNDFHYYLLELMCFSTKEE